MDVIDRVREAIAEASAYNKSKSEDFGEVFTPFELIEEMLDSIDASVWSDKTKTFFDPCSGKGNFPICIVKRLFDGLVNEIPDAEERLRHIVENQLFMSEYQKVSADFLREQFTFGLKDVKINLYHGDSLKMPEGWFDKPWVEREQILNDHPDGHVVREDKSGHEVQTNLFDMFS